MSHVNAKGGVRELRVGAVITRASGRVENHGRIAFGGGSIWQWLLWRIERLTVYRLKRLYWRLT